MPINKPAIKQTAAHAYAERYNQARELIERLGKRLRVHRDLQSLDPRNWGYAGDLAHINDELLQALAFMAEDQAVNELVRSGRF